MLAFAHIPTGTTANKGFNIDDEVNGRLVEPAVALTAIGAKSKPVGLHLKTWLRLSHVRGPPQYAYFAINIQSRFPLLPSPELTVNIPFSGCSLDLNAFFASSEQHESPALRGKPITRADADGFGRRHCGQLCGEGFGISAGT
jgi:hypothetical protein